MKVVICLPVSSTSTSWVCIYYEGSDITEIKMWLIGSNINVTLPFLLHKYYRFFDIRLGVNVLQELGLMVCPLIICSRLYVTCVCLFVCLFACPCVYAPVRARVCTPVYACARNCEYMQLCACVRVCVMQYIVDYYFWSFNTKWTSSTR